MLATLVAAPFDDPDWLFEVKWDGFRVETVVDGGGARLWTRGQKDAAATMSPSATTLEHPTGHARLTRPRGVARVAGQARMTRIGPATAA